MTAKTVTEFVILKLTYVPSYVVIGPPVVENFRTPRGPPCRAHPLLDWYYRVMSKEQQEPNDNNVQFRMWRIKSHDAKLFKMYYTRFDKLYLFLGEQTIHWIFYTPKPIFLCVDGSTELTLNYSRCCFHEQYMQFIKRIQEEEVENEDPIAFLLS